MTVRWPPFLAVVMGAAPANVLADTELELDPPLLSSLPQAAATSMSAAAIAAAAEALRTCTVPSSVVGVRRGLGRCRPNAKTNV